MGKICFVTATWRLECPSCRAKQIDAIVKEMPADLPGLIAGDFNSNTFCPRSMLTTLQGFARLMFFKMPTDLKVDQTPLSPSSHCFHLETGQAFEENGFNDGAVGCFVPMTMPEDSKKAPRVSASAVNRQMAKIQWTPGFSPWTGSWVAGLGH